MKTKIYILLLVGISLFSSCQDWLDVSSSTQVTAEDLFKTESGFQDALVGVYLNMASTDLYAKNLSWHFIDVLGQPYVVPPSGSSDSYYIKKYSYTSTNVKSYINTIWTKSYTTIANINNELKYADQNAGVLNPISKNLYKGELLALRAYLHLDLLRMFGYGDLSNRSDYETRLTIPYVTTYSKEQTPQLSYKETMTLLIQDLKDAIGLLSDDPIRNLHAADPEYYNEVNANGFWSNRGKRLNYYATKALLARAYMWEGSDASLTAAFEIAQELTAKENEIFQWIKYSNISSTDATMIDRTFSTEHLFSLDVYDFTNKVNQYIVDPGTSNGINTNYFLQKGVEETVFESKYYGNWGYYYAPNNPLAGTDKTIALNIPDGQDGIAGPGVNDYRYNLHYRITNVNSTNAYYLIKFYQPASYNTSFKNRIPLIKISEMYYIMAEYYLRHQDEPAAINVLNTVRTHRGLEVGIDPTMMISVQSELTKEYMREFIGEGQLFFYLKRLNLLDPTYYGVSAGNAGIQDYTFNEAKFLIPLPDDEITYGNRVQ